MTGKLFANLSNTDARTLAEQELAELSDWQRRLAIADYEFASEQKAVIEALFTPKDRADLDRLIRDTWYSAARTAIPLAIERRRQLLGLEPPPEEANETKNPDEIDDLAGTGD